jgi:hypothetical protein
MDLPPSEQTKELLETSAPAAEVSSEIVEVSGRAGMVGFLTFLSRIFGLARDTLIAYLLGAREAADAFYVAFRIPNLLRRLLAEGCLTISFVPVFTEYLKKDRKDAKRVVDATSPFFRFFSCHYPQSVSAFAALCENDDLRLH